MKSQLSITCDDAYGVMVIDCPFSKIVTLAVRMAGARWCPERIAWTMADNEKTHRLIARLFGEPSPDVVVKIDATDKRLTNKGGELTLGGYLLATRRHCLHTVELPAAVHIENGYLPHSGGTLRCPKVTWEGKLKFELAVRRSFAVRHKLKIVKEQIAVTDSHDALGEINAIARELL